MATSSTTKPSILKRVSRLGRERVTPAPNNILRNGRTIQRWRLWLVKLLFVQFILGELYLGSYISEWGVFTSRFVGGAVAILFVYFATVWIVTGVGHLWRNGLPERHTLQERADSPDKSLSFSTRSKTAAILGLFLLVSVTEPVQTLPGAFGQLLGAYLVVTLVEYAVVKSRKRRVKTT